MPGVVFAAAMETARPAGAMARSLSTSREGAGERTPERGEPWPNKPFLQGLSVRG